MKKNWSNILEISELSFIPLQLRALDVLSENLGMLFENTKNKKLRDLRKKSKTVFFIDLILTLCRF